ncbi:MAG: DUF4830 domain-containing protein [Ruminococcus sp.]|nr:DUF4830 domain-containing protein [Ruminococcus sp.]
MFVLKLKIGKKHIISIVISIIAAVLLFMILILTASGNAAPNDSATCDELGKYSLVAQTVGGEIGFLKHFGFDVISESRECETVTIPSEFNETYEEYNELQKKIGLDLEKYKGRDAQKITYELNNSDEKYAVILTINGRVIGAHLTNGEYGDVNKSLI